MLTPYTPIQLEELQGTHLKDQADGVSNAVGSLDGIEASDVKNLPLPVWNVRACIERVGVEKGIWSPGQNTSYQSYLKKDTTPIEPIDSMPIRIFSVVNRV